LNLFNSNNNSIKDNIFFGSMDGIEFIFSNGNNFTRNHLSDQGGSMILSRSNKNIIYDNIFFDNIFGLMLIFSNESIVENNNFTYNWAGPGVYITGSSDNIVSNNMFYENREGINISDSPFFFNTANNKVFHNSLIGNTNQAYDDTISENYWDDGYPSGGNYWDDYTGVDIKNGPNQDISGGDGIGDSSYNIESGTRDNYPLMEPWGIDSAAPSIELISPPDESFIDIGTKINLSISDLNLDEVTYSINNGGYEILTSPYDINTSDWTDGDYAVEVQASDTSDNIKTIVYHFFVDTKPPTITLASPDNNSMINADSIIEFTIFDTNIDEVIYSKNSGIPTLLYQPYNINPNGWSEGEHIISVLAKDKASNSNEKWFRFTLDKTSPQIILNSPANGSIIQDSSVDFDVSDENLNSVHYIINQGIYTSLQAPYDLNTIDWNDGEYRITIIADDAAGNSNEKWFIFTKDATLPSIISIYPKDNSIDIQIDENIVIEFSEQMDLQSVESAILISPHSEYSCKWSNDNLTLTLNFSDPLEYETLYQISIGTSAKDLASNTLESKYDFEFITQDKQKSGVDESDMFPSIVLILVLISIITSIMIVLLLVKRKKNTQDRVGAWPQLQEKSMEIMCPQCGFYFMAVKTGGPIRVQCPNCGTAGTLG
jgi:parallel beta-helix repeat protein